jgi:branched-chain amino acid transport system ATP-binding protein
MLLQANDLKVVYSGVEALKGLSLELAEGEIITVIGANGAGKTTLLNAISGLVMLESGEIRFEGTKINGLSTPERVQRGIAHVPEGRHVFTHLSVFENLEMGAYLRKDAVEVKADLEKVFALFPRLRERQKQRSLSLSGGEQQMLAVGRALMSRPKLLLMDEPTLGLSPKLCRDLAHMITEINKAGMSILLVEQNARMALRIARRGYVLQTGTILVQGSGEELLNDHYVRKAYLGN